MKTVLIVDDDRQLRGMFTRALERKGYRTIEADSGPEGLALARKHLPDLILSDIHMPGGDGSTLLRDIRQDPELRSKQVVLMTGRPDLVTPRRGMEDGADDFLLKPVDLQALSNCVEARFKRASVSWRVEDQMLGQLRTLVPPHLPHEFFTPLGRHHRLDGNPPFRCTGLNARGPCRYSWRYLFVRNSTSSHPPELSPDPRTPKRRAAPSPGPSHSR